MAIMARDNGSGGDFQPAPEGSHQAVCVDVIDKGELTDQFGTKHKIDIAWQLPHLRDDGKRFVVYKRYTLSLHEKATLRHDLESWRGRAFTREESMGFDVEKLIGANALINVLHNTKGDKTYANVMSLMPLVGGMQKMQPLDYVRKEEKQPEVQPAADVVNDDIPF